MFFLIYSCIPFIYIKKKNNPGPHTVFQKQQEMTEIKEMTEKLKKKFDLPREKYKYVYL